MIKVEDGGTAVTIDSHYGYSEESRIAEAVDVLLKDEEIAAKVCEGLESDTRREEIREEQLGFARMLLDEIQGHIKGLPNKPLKGDLKEALEGILYSIDNSMFEG
jgi:hypothetical protein